MDERQTNRPHRVKRDRKGKGKDKAGRNPKAFIASSAVKANVRARRNAQLEQHRLHVPAVDRTFGDHDVNTGQGGSAADAASNLDPPPVIVAISGPPGVGKSTLVRSLVRRYTKTTMSDIRGPVTMVSTKTRRLTLIEVPNDIGAAVDVAKIADLVLLIVDGSFGFEMETFETITALQSHGMPKIIGILTHLDLVKKPETLKAQKKRLKHRFWTEIYDGAKMFYLSGVWNGRYPDREILNLSRFINAAKFRPLAFRNQHSYFLADRFEDITPREQIRLHPAGDRTVALCGYLRGLPLRPPTGPLHPIHLHIPGSGVDALEGVTLKSLSDPCPLPTLEGEKRRKLSEKHRLVHAPMSGGAGGAVTFDGDRLWINTPGNFSRARATTDNDEFVGEGERMVMDLQDMRETLGQTFTASDIRLLDGDTEHTDLTLPVQISEDTRSPFDGNKRAPRHVDLDGPPGTDPRMPAQRARPRRPAFPVALPDYNDASATALQSVDTSSEYDNDSARDSDGAPSESQASSGSESGVLRGEVRWKANLRDRARSNFVAATSRRKRDLARLIYLSDLSPNEVIRGEIRPKTSTPDDTELFVLRSEHATPREDRRRPLLAADRLAQDYITESSLDSLRCFFITGGNMQAKDSQNSEAGDFEDLEDGDVDQHAAPSAPPAMQEPDLAAKKLALKRKFDEQYDGSSDGEEGSAGGKDFFSEQKEDMARRLQDTRNEFADDDDETRIRVQGYRAGTYIRLVVAKVSCELVDNFDARMPLIVGSLLGAELEFGLVQIRLKRHRWHGKILKTNDPLILSMGWRRFQTLPVYSLDDGTRNRMLKYTPEHMHCLATFYGPLAAPASGICAFNTLSATTPTFRVAATGVVLDNDSGSRIVKKLKLTGSPLKIFKNTAFVKDMFTSSLEVAKFEGAHIRTVSGVRGQIKKALAKPDGSFRAAFEDRVLMSDLIFLRAWHSVQPRRYYNPIASLLMENKAAWSGMRLTGTVRFEQGMKTPLAINSVYQDVDRPIRRFNPLKVPKKLQAALPYASKPKLQHARSHSTYMQQRAVVLEPAEKKALGLLQQIQAIEKVKGVKRREKRRQTNIDRRKELDKSDTKRLEREKRERKEYYREQGKEVERRANASASKARRSTTSHSI